MDLIERSTPTAVLMMSRYALSRMSCWECGRCRYGKLVWQLVHESIVEVQDRRRRNIPAGTAKELDSICEDFDGCNNGHYMRNTRITRIDHKSQEALFSRPRNKTEFHNQGYFPDVTSLSWKED